MLKINNYVLNGKKEFSIVHFSDIHYSKNFNDVKLDNIINKVKELNPSYICITGDLVDNIDVTESMMMKLESFFMELSKTAKVIVGLGNHDLRKYKDLNNNNWYLKLKEINNVVVLNNSQYVENDICFYGFTPSDKYYEDEYKNSIVLQNEMKKISIIKKEYNVLLVHTPFHLKEEPFYELLKDFQLVLCGHTHNGLVPHFIPGNFGFITPNKKIFGQNVRNSFKNKEISVIISGGITKLSEGTGILHKLDCFYKEDINYITIKNL